LPRKELYEAWEWRVASDTLARGRVVDLGAGHGLLAQVMLLLDDTSPNAIVADKTLPASAATLHQALVETWRGWPAVWRSSRNRWTTSSCPRMTSWSRAMRADA